MSDVLIVGGGHNGLTWAAYLQRGGRSVTALKANGRAGGFAATVDHPGAPGFRGTEAFDHVLTNIAPSVIDELAFARHGHRMVTPDPHVDHAMAQFGPWRPAPTLAGHQTLWEGLWHTGAGAHPCGLMNGRSGRNTAKRILKEIA